ncbi:MAG: hypothetical protein ACREDJ_06200, partial [Methylocella sp.]
MGPVEGAEIGGPAMRARGASPLAGAGAVRGAGLTGRSAANDVAGASVRALADRRRQEHIYA